MVYLNLLGDLAVHVVVSPDDPAVAAMKTFEKREYEMSCAKFS
jgi:hypothetical protein